MKTVTRSHAPLVKQFPSRFIPRIVDAEIREFSRPEIKTATFIRDEDAPPPFTAEMEIMAEIFAGIGETPKREAKKEEPKKAAPAPKPEMTEPPKFTDHNGYRAIRARFPSRCSETEERIEAGEWILWSPRRKFVFKLNPQSTISQYADGWKLDATRGN